MHTTDELIAMGLMHPATLTVDGPAYGVVEGFWLVDNLAISSAQLDKFTITPSTIGVDMGRMQPWADKSLFFQMWRGTVQLLDGEAEAPAAEVPPKPNQEAVQAELQADFVDATPSDHTGIWKWHDASRVTALLGKHTPKAPTPPPSKARPALAGLGVTASGDHRMGLGRTFE